jgi:hypothetical protein
MGKDTMALLAARRVPGNAHHRMKAGRFAHARKKGAFFQRFLPFSPCVPLLRSL